MAAAAEKNRGDTTSTPSRGAVGVVVLGPGRSGTSAVARTFVTAGFFAGQDDELYGPDPGNPLGHYEPLSVLAVNEELLERFGCTWWADSPTPEEQLPLRAEMEPRLRSVLASLTAASDGAPVVVKEPRINGLLPLWQPVFDDVLHPVLTIRDPLEMALSHARRDGTSLFPALAAWEVQMTQVLSWLHGRVATVALYAQLTEEPRLADDLVGGVLSHLDPECARRVTSSKASSALRSDMRHEDADGLDRAEYLTASQAALWDYLQSLPGGNARLALPDPLKSPRKAAHRAMRKETERIELVKDHAALAAELEKTRQRAVELERQFAEATSLAQEAVDAANERAHQAAQATADHARELERIKASASWRITAPLRRFKRLLDDRHPG